MSDAQLTSLRAEFGDMWSVAVALWLMSLIFFGGTGFPSPFVQNYFVVSAFTFIALALWRLRGGFPSGAAAFGAVISALSFALVLVQLIPIPFDIWKTLPGRDVVLRAIEAVGVEPETLPLTLSPVATKTAALSILPPLAAYLAVLSVPRRAFCWISGAIVVCAMVGSLIGMVQYSRGAASGLYFYHDPGMARFATGTFANKNMFASQLCITLPFLAAFSMTWSRRLRIRPLLTWVFTLFYIGLFVAVLAIIGSRAGILLGMVSAFLTILLVFRPSEHRSRAMGVGKGVLAMLGTVVVISQSSMVGILRIAETDPLTEHRSNIMRVSFEAAQAQFPAGSGFGTFVPVYQIYETASTIVDPYINRAHSDWMELAIEGGLSALLLAAIALCWLTYLLYRALRMAPQEPTHAHIRAAGVAAFLLLVHALVDFPFRTDALLTLLGLSFGFLALSTATVSRRDHGISNPSSRAMPATAPAAPRASLSGGRGIGGNWPGNGGSGQPAAKASPQGRRGS